MKHTMSTEAEEYYPCHHCDGSGRVLDQDRIETAEDCSYCDGTGEADGEADGEAGRAPTRV